MIDPETREEAIDLWQDAQFNSGCSCFVSPPCSYCVDGFSLSLEEYLENLGFDPEDPVDENEQKIKAYEEAMKIL